MIDHIHQYIGSVGIFVAIAACFGVLALLGLLIRREKKPPAVEVDPPEPIQKYDRFPEPRPMKTIETRDGPEPPY